MSSFMRIADEAFRLRLCEGAKTPTAPSRLVAARGDTAAFQIILSSNRNYSVNVSREEWTTAKYRRLLGEQERLRVAVNTAFPVRLLNEGFHVDDDETEKADILLTQSVRESRANASSAVWAEIAVPADAEAGDYAVEIALYSSLLNEDERLIEKAELTLHVSSYVLPEERSFYLDLWQHSSNIARKHDVPLWSDEHFAVLRNYVRSLAALGQKSILVCASHTPWEGQDCYLDRAHGGNLYEYSMIGITRKKDGSLEFDYSAMQRYIDMCTEEGITGDIEVIGLVNTWGTEKFCPRTIETGYPEKLRLLYLDDSDGALKYIRKQEEIEEYIRSLEQYFIRTSQIDRVRIGADEPGDIEKYRSSLDALQKIAPHFRCKTAINHAEFIEEFNDRIDDFAPYLGCTLREYDRLMEYREKYPEKRFLWYICCGSTRPNTFLGSDPIEARFIGILTSLLRLDGFLRWNYTVWPENPRSDIRYSAFEAGDTNFVYPAYNGDVLLSLRYKNLQRGIADYEMIEELRRRKGDAAVNELLKRVAFFADVRSFNTSGYKEGKSLFSTEFEDYNTLKAELLLQLEENV